MPDEVRHRRGSCSKRGSARDKNGTGIIGRIITVGNWARTKWNGVKSVNHLSSIYVPFSKVSTEYDPQDCELRPQEGRREPLGEGSTLRAKLVAGKEAFETEGVKDGARRGLPMLWQGETHWGVSPSPFAVPPLPSI